MKLVVANIRIGAGIEQQPRDVDGATTNIGGGTIWKDAVSLQFSLSSRISGSNQSKGSLLLLTITALV